MPKFFFTLVLLLYFVESHAVVKSFGHNLSATSHVLDDNEATIGLPVAAYGLTDEVSVGTSIWLLSDYNMYNAYVRYRYFKDEGDSQAVQFGVFQTDLKSSTYNMAAAWLNWIYGFHFQNGYNFFINVQGMFYANERRPFSLRRPRIWRDPTEWNVMTLHEVPLVNRFFIMSEMGIVGFLRKYPIVHTGASLQWRSCSWLIQVGFSMTGSLQALSFPDRRRDNSFVSNGDNHGLGDGASELVKYDFSLHPEFAFQYFF